MASFLSSLLMGGSRADCAEAAPSPTVIAPMAAQPASSPEAEAEAAAVAAAAAQPAGPPPNNPGSFDRADQDVKGVLNLPVFDGAQFDIRKTLNPNFVVTHTVNMGSQAIKGGSHYACGATVASNGGSFMVGNVDQTGKIDARMGYTTPRVHALMFAQLASDSAQSAFNPQVDYLGDDFTAGLKFGSGHAGVSYFQKLGSKLSMGGDGIYLTQRRQTILNARAKYKDEKNTALVSVSGMGPSMSCSYHRKVNDSVALATELELVPSTRDSHVSLGYQVTFRQSKLSATINSEYVIQSVAEEIVAPGLRFLFSSQMDHVNEQHRFGVGIQIGD